jgi:hypothetical protein
LAWRLSRNAVFCSVISVVGFLVSAMGMGLIFHGVVEALQNYGIGTEH